MKQKTARELQGMNYDIDHSAKRKSRQRKKKPRPVGGNKNRQMHMEKAGSGVRSRGEKTGEHRIGGKS